MNLTEYSQVKRTKVLVYGEPKSGKTALVGKLASAGYKLHWFDLENGVKTLLNPEILPAEFRKNISLFNIPDHRAYPIGIQVLRTLFNGGKKKYCYNHGAHMCAVCSKTPGLQWSEEIELATFTDQDVLVIDSWTQVVQSAINKVAFNASKKDDEYRPTFDDWRGQGLYLDEVLSKIQVSNINVCVISHDVDVEKDEKKEKIVPIGGTRNFSKTVAKYFDEVIYVQRLNKAHKAYSSSTWDNIHLTGGRSGTSIEEGYNLAEIFTGKRKERETNGKST